jgi:hypothetical protein
MQALAVKQKRTVNGESRTVVIATGVRVVALWDSVDDLHDRGG